MLNVKFNIYKIIFFFLILILFVLLFKTSSVSALEEEIYTREQMQKMVVSTALSYYYNNSYSDYSQTSMDKIEDGGDYSAATLYHRNLNITPEQVNRGNYYKIDCSGFTFLSYFNTFGYDASEYSSINSYMLFNGHSENKMKKVNEFSNTVYYHRLAYKKFGQAWNNSYLTKMSNRISGTCSTESCSSSNANGIVYNNMNNAKGNELAYYYYSQQYRTSTALKEEWAKVKDKLQPGDIILVNKTTSNFADEGTFSGHVMLYVGENDKLAYDRNLIHSTGYDVNYSENSQYNKLHKSTSILVSDADTFIENRIDAADGAQNGNGTGYLRLFAIIRPINTMCENDTSCKFDNNTYNVDLSEEKKSNAKARVELSNYRFEQFATSHDNFGNQINILNNNNSVNAGNKIRYNLQITNKSNTPGPIITIQAKVPTNSEYVSCTENCVYDAENRTVTWNNVSLETKNSIATYRYVVIPLEDGTLENEGMYVKTADNTLKFGSIKTNVKATFDISNSNLIIDEINKLKSAILENKISYSSSVGEYKFDLDNLNNSVSMSNASFSKTIYYNAYGIDLGFLNSADIKNALFNRISDARINIYSKKTDSEVSNITDNSYKIINKMLVPGMYGGIKLKGNDNNDRIKNIRSYNYGVGLSSDLQVGDIIISYNTNCTYIKTYFITGFDSSGPILSVFNSNLNIIEYNNTYLTGDDAYYLDTVDSSKKPSEQILNELFNQDLFVVLRPSRVYGTTVIKNYNNTKNEVKTYIAYDSYKNLDTPTRTDNKYTVTYECDGLCKSEDVSNSKFAGWYSDSKFENQINNDTELISNDAHRIYAKWQNENIILPTVEKQGFNFLGWYNDDKKIADGGEEYVPSENITLTAKFEFLNNIPDIETTSEYKIKNNLITNIALKTTVETLDLGLENTYTVKIFNKNNALKTTGLLATGDKLKVMLGNETVLEYIIVVKGDVTGTGTSTVSDVAKLYQYLKGKINMENCYIEAGNVVGEETEIRVNDVAKLYQFIKNKITSLEV